MIDTHCHIDDPIYVSDLDSVISRQKEAGVAAILVPGVTAGSCATVVDVCRRYPHYLYPALGLHPEEVRADYEAQLSIIHAAIGKLMSLRGSVEEPHLVAIGEVGLDYHFSTEFKAEQHRAFRQQLGWAAELDLPVMVHSRDATEDTYNIIKECSSMSLTRYSRPLRGVMHCFSGSYETAMRYVTMGWKLGIGGVITFKNSKLAENLCPNDGRPSVPLSSLVLETDAPYMTPVPYRGQPNESRYMSFVVERLAATYRVTPYEVISLTTATTTALFLEK